MDAIPYPAGKNNPRTIDMPLKSFNEGLSSEY